jgi:hypothetical protein
LPLLGAARLYVDHVEWQARVLELIHLASLVVMRVDTTPGIHWEIEQITRLVPPERIVLLLPRDLSRYNEWKLAIEHLLPVPLLDDPPLMRIPGRRHARNAVRLSQATDIGGIIVFASDWTPRQIGFGAADEQYYGSYPNTQLARFYFSYSLRWIIKSLTGRWIPPPNQFARAAIVTEAACWGTIFLVTSLR